MAEENSSTITNFEEFIPTDLYGDIPNINIGVPGAELYEELPILKDKEVIKPELIQGTIPALKFPSFTQDVYVDIMDKTPNQSPIIYLGDSPFKEDYGPITNENEKSWFLESFLGLDVRKQISSEKKQEYDKYMEDLVKEVGLEAYFPKEVATIAGSFTGPAALNWFSQNPQYIPKTGSGAKAFQKVFNGLWQFQKNTIDKLPIPEKMKKPIKKRLIVGSIAAAGVAGAAGFGYDTYSDYIDGDEETVEEIVAKLPENLKTEAINEAIGLGIFKIAKLGKEQVVYGTEAMRKKLADFYESGIKPVLADVVNEGGTLGTAFLRSFGKLPLVSDRLGQFMKEQGPIVRDKVDRMIEALAPRSGKDSGTLFLEKMLKGRAEWKAVTGAAYDNFYKQIDNIFGKGASIFPMVKTRSYLSDFVQKANKQASGVLQDSPVYKFAKNFLEKSKGKKLKIEDYKFYRDELNDIYNTIPYEDATSRNLIDELKDSFADDLSYLTSPEKGAFVVNQAGEIVSSVFPRTLNKEQLTLLQESKKFADDIFRFGVDRDQAMPMGKDFFDKGVFAKMTQTYRQGTDTEAFRKLIGFGDEGYTVTKTINLPGAPGTKIQQTYTVNQLYQTPLSKEGTQYYEQVWKPVLSKLNSPTAVKQLFKLTGEDPNVFGSFVQKLMDDSMMNASKALSEAGENVSSFAATKNFLQFDPVKFRDGIFGTKDQMKEGIKEAFNLLHARNPKEFLSGNQLEKLLDVLVARGNTFVPSAAGLLNKKLSIGAVNLTTGLMGILFGGFTGLKGGLGAPLFFLRLRGMANVLGDPKKAKAFYAAMNDATSYKTRYSNFLRLLEMTITDKMEEAYKEGSDAYDQHKNEINEMQLLFQEGTKFLDKMADDYDGDLFEEQMLNDVETINSKPKNIPNVSRGKTDVPLIQPINIPQVDFASLGGGQGGGATNPQTMASLQSVGLPLFQAAEGGIVDLYESKKFKRPQVVA